MRWTIGDITVTRVLEGEWGEILPTLIPAASPEAVLPIAWLRPDFVTEAGKLKINVQAFLLDLAGARILVDTCVGNDKALPVANFWSDLDLPFLERLAAAGATRESIDVVLCTHLHVDHVGWNTMKVDGRWVPTFPNARYLFGREELAHFRHHVAHGEETRLLPLDQAVFAQSVNPILESGQMEEVESDHQIAPGVRLIPTPGHTPGHVSVLIESAGTTALITGDCIHHPCQIAHPEWTSISDTSPDDAVVTRRDLFERLAGSQTLMIGSHWAGCGAGHVVREGEGYRLATQSEPTA